MAQKVYKIGHITTELLPVTESTIWRWVRQGKFPKPFKIGPMTTVWDSQIVDDWLEQQRSVAPEACRNPVTLRPDSRRPGRPRKLVGEV